MKQAIFEITGEFAIALCSGAGDLAGAGRSFVVTKFPIPQGAKVIRLFQDDRRGTIGIVLEHESFVDVPHGCLIPTLPTPQLTVECIP